MTQKEYRKVNWDRVREIERRSHAKNAHKREAYRKNRWAKDGDKLREYYRNYFSKNRERRKQVLKKYHAANRGEINAKGRERYHATPEYQRLRRERYYLEHKEDKSEYAKEYRKKHAEKLRVHKLKWRALQRKNNPAYRILNSCRCKMYIALKAQDAVKSSRSIVLLGCTGKFFQEYLEHQFAKKMNWYNYGTYWNVDHVIPVSKFDLTTGEGQRKAFHYSNCRPMVAVKNFVKGATLPGAHQPFLL